MIIKIVAAAVLLTGVVDQINDDSATIEYKLGDKVFYTTVSVSNSDCIPREGDRVKFITDDKIYLCEGKK